MQPTPVIAIFDVGKTNKKGFLFDEEYRIVHEETILFEETEDEDGFPCEDLARLTTWIHNTFKKFQEMTDYKIKAVNFSAYGASFVHVDGGNNLAAPLYNYLKPYPEELQQQFYRAYGGEEVFSQQTASPVLGNLNSGMLLYWLKYRRPELFQQINCSLHLPQYLSFLITGTRYADITSIGCHTALWHFSKNEYHPWVTTENVDEKMAPVYKSDEAIKITTADGQLDVGIGLHDSSAALIPYLTSFTQPFVLISTGTWCISLNPFNSTELTLEELRQDCLSYLTYHGNPVKASRLFAGNEHGQQAKKIAGFFNVSDDFYKAVSYDAGLITRLKENDLLASEKKYIGGTDVSDFGNRDLADYSLPAEAYHQLIMDIIKQQVASTGLVLRNSPVEKIFVDGGFSQNPIYMNLLAQAFGNIGVYAASVAQASALGAALALHGTWNDKPLPGSLVDLKIYEG